MTPQVPFPKFGNGPGLARCALVAKRLGVDLAGFGETGAVIVGSNGKGSTAAMCAALLNQHAVTGLFTSPHLFDLNERFQIGGAPISDTELQHHWARVLAAVQAEALQDDLGGFEFLFLIAADWFAARGCAHTVWEAGIGGRLDPVRLIEAKHLALTSLDLEHTALLGDTLAEIGRDKLDAAPSGATVFVPDLERDLHAALSAHAAVNGVLLAVTPALAGYDVPLLGAHQRQNAALAVQLALALAPLNQAQVQTGLNATRWPGRLEILSEQPLIVIDVGHTPAAIAAARAGFDCLREGREAVLICGASQDKDVAPLISALAPGFATIICTAAAHKGAPPAEIARIATEANPAARTIAAPTMAIARDLALAATPANGALYMAGGLFVAAEFRAIHLGRDPAALAFF